MKSKIFVVLLVSISLFLSNKMAMCQNNVTSFNDKSIKYGVTEEEMKEYTAIISKYHLEPDNKTSWENFKKQLTNKDKQRLKEIFTKMNNEQQKQQFVICREATKPLPKMVPTLDQLKSWKNENLYGVWIDGKKIDNKDLNNYTNTDFDQFFVSKLYKNAKEGKRYSYQVDLMTPKYYNNYFQETIAKGDIDIFYKMSINQKSFLSR